jgi:hypothetical protein
MKYTRPQSNYHERNLGILNTRAARRIHQVEYKDMETAKGALRAVGLGFLAWFLFMAVVIGVMAVWP